MVRTAARSIQLIASLIHSEIIIFNLSCLGGDSSQTAGVSSRMCENCSRINHKSRFGKLKKKSRMFWYGGVIGNSLQKYRTVKLGVHFVSAASSYLSSWYICLLGYHSTAHWYSSVCGVAVNPFIIALNSRIFTFLGLAQAQGPFFFCVAALLLHKNDSYWSAPFVSLAGWSNRYLRIWCNY